MKFTKLFEPCRIGGVELTNRIVMPPITTNFAKEGFVTDQMLNYYSERGRGGVGLVIVEDGIIYSLHGHHTFNDLLIDDDKYLPGLHRLAKAINTGGAKTAINLSHPGSIAGRAIFGQDSLPVAPSAIPDPSPGSTMPRELDINEIVEIEDKFAIAALRAREAGFDMICLHGAHGYLINQFLSPARNQRKDSYGGDNTGRTRFLLEIIRKVRAKVGNDYPIIARIPVEEHAEGGLKIEDGKKISRRLEAEGIDCISPSVDNGLRGVRTGIPPLTAPMRIPPACMVYLARELKQIVSIPIMAANRIVTPQLAEEILEQGKADLIGIGRGLIADPEWPKKAKEGREGDIRHCISCMYCLASQYYGNKGMRCAVNAAAGQEMECKISSATKSKRVFVAGGGPAGLEAARVAALRGHKVRLFEKGKLGGQLNIACIPPGKNAIKLLLSFLKGQLDRVGVKVESTELNPEVVRQDKPDAVIVATGARPVVPSLSGAQKESVFNAWQVLQEEVVVGDVVVVVGGGEIGAETSEYLAAKGKQVIILEMMNEIAADSYPYTRELLLSSLDKLGVILRTKTTVKEIADHGVMIYADGKYQFVKADTVITALGSLPNEELAEQLKGVVSELYIIGDCAKARRLPEAIEEGLRAGLRV